MRRDVTLSPFSSQRVFFLTGWASNNLEITELVKKYRADTFDEVFEASSEKWREEGIRFSVNNLDWIEREVFHHYHYTLSTVTYDDYFEESIIDQGTNYRYVNGFQGAERGIPYPFLIVHIGVDPLQHALPLILTRPGL